MKKRLGHIGRIGLILMMAALSRDAATAGSPRVNDTTGNLLYPTNFWDEPGNKANLQRVSSGSATVNPLAIVDVYTTNRVNTNVVLSFGAGTAGGNGFMNSRWVFDAAGVSGSFTNGTSTIITNVSGLYIFCNVGASSTPFTQSSCLQTNVWSLGNGWAHNGDGMITLFEGTIYSSNLWPPVAGGGGNGNYATNATYASYATNAGTAATANTAATATNAAAGGNIVTSGSSPTLGTVSVSSLSSSGNISATPNGTVTAQYFNGSGAFLSALPASQITGTLANNTTGNAAFATNSGYATYATTATNLSGTINATQVVGLVAGGGVTGWTTNAAIATVTTNVTYVTNSYVALLNGLTAYWKMDETSGTRYDATTNGYNLTDVTGNITSTSGVINNAADFAANGTGGAGLQHSGSMAPSVMTVGMWVQASPTGSSLQMFWQSATFSLYYGGSSYGMTAALYDSGSSSPKVWQTNGWPSSGWTYYTAVYTTSNLAMYVGGVMVSNQPVNGTINNTWPNTIYIGSDGGGDGRTTTGAIDEVGVWSRALTTDEIAFLAATNGYSTFSSGGGGTVTTNYTYVTNVVSVLVTNTGVVNLQGGAFVANPVVTNGATANGQVPVLNAAVAGGYNWAAQSAGIVNGQANVGLTAQFLVTNTAVAGGFSSDNPPIYGLVDNYYGVSPALFGIDFQAITGGWVTYPNYYMAFSGSYPYGNGIVGEGGLQTYMYNNHVIGVGGGNGNNGSGDNRLAVGVACLYGTQGADGGQIEMLVRKNSSALGGSSGWLYAEGIKYDGYSRVQLGNNPQSEHTLWYPGHAYVDVRTGGNTDVPALLIRDEALASTPVYGALEKSGGSLWWTDNTNNRASVFTGYNAGNVTNLNARALVISNTTAIYAHLSGTNIWFSTTP